MTVIVVRRRAPVDEVGAGDDSAAQIGLVGIDSGVDDRNRDASRPAARVPHAGKADQAQTCLERPLGVVRRRVEDVRDDVRRCVHDDVGVAQNPHRSGLARWADADEVRVDRRDRPLHLHTGLRERGPDAAGCDTGHGHHADVRRVALDHGWRSRNRAVGRRFRLHVLRLSLGRRAGAAVDGAAELDDWIDHQADRWLGGGTSLALGTRQRGGGKQRETDALHVPWSRSPAAAGERGLAADEEPRPAIFAGVPGKGHRRRKTCGARLRTFERCVTL